MAKPTLPIHLHAAYEWIDSAGEWDEALLNPSEYAEVAATSAEMHEHHEVTEGDLLSAIAWYRDNL